LWYFSSTKKRKKDPIPVASTSTCTTAGFLILFLNSTLIVKYSLHAILFYYQLFKATTDTCNTILQLQIVSKWKDNEYQNDLFEIFIGYKQTASFK